MASWQLAAYTYTTTSTGQPLHTHDVWCVYAPKTRESERDEEEEEKEGAARGRGREKIAYMALLANGTRNHYIIKAPSALRWLQQRSRLGAAAALGSRNLSAAGANIIRACK